MAAPDETAPPTPGADRPATGVAPTDNAPWRAGGRSALGPLLTTARSLSAAARGYRPGFLRGDLLAAVTVALVAVPQSMAFATIAGLPPVYGLYTAVVVTLVGGLLTGSPQLHVGPTNTMSLLTASALVALAVGDGDASAAERVQTAAMLALFAGLMQIAFAVGRLGELVRFVSRSVIVGFSAGAGVLIAVGQLPPLLGIELAGTQSGLGGALGKLHRIGQALFEHGAVPAWPAVTVGLVSLAVAVGCRRVAGWLPRYLLAIVAGALTVYLMGWTDADLTRVGALPAGLPAFAPPTFDWHAYRSLVAPAFAIALVGMIEVCGIGKTLAAKTGHRVEPNQEFLAIGVANVLGGCFRCLPSSASYSRSALNQQTGARTRFAAVASAFITAGLFLLAAPAAAFIPMASIAAILFPIAWGLIDFDYVRKLRHSNRADLWVCVATFAATLTLPLEIAVFTGVFLTLALYLRRARQLYITEMVGGGDDDPRRPTGWTERPLRANAACDPRRAVSFLQIEGNLFFASADDLQDRFIRVLAQKEVHVLILRLKRTHMVDATVMHTIEAFARQMRGEDRHLILCGLRPRMRERMIAFGLGAVAGEDNLIVSGAKPFDAARAAVKRAHALVEHVSPGEAPTDTSCLS